MKIILVSLCIILTFALNCFSCEHDKILFKLSVVSQNANADFECLASDVAPPPDLILSYVKKIDVLLDTLVDKGHFKKEKLELKAPKNMSLKEQERLSEVIEGFSSILALKYGMYSSREMLDFGLRRGLVDAASNEPIVLNIRMPKNLMSEFLLKIKKIKM